MIGSPVLRFLLNFQRDDEIFEVLVSTDGGASFQLLERYETNQGTPSAAPGEAIELSLTPFAGEPDVRLRFRYADPMNTAPQAGSYAQVDDVLVYDDISIFANGFESGNTSAWSVSP